MSIKEMYEGYRTCSRFTQDAIISLIDWMGDDHFIRWIREQAVDFETIKQTALIHAWNCVKE